MDAGIYRGWNRLAQYCEVLEEHMTAFGISAIAILGFFFIWYFKGPAAASFIAILAACTLTTIDFVSLGNSTIMTAMAPPGLTFATFHLALLGGLLSLPSQTLKNISPWFVLFIGSIIVLMVFRDLVVPHVLSGVVQWVSVVVAWGVGGAIAQSARREGRPSERFVAISVAIVIGWHAAATALQVLGARAVSSIAVGDLEVARASGLAGHSGNLGKIMFFMIVILLPVTRSADLVARRWAVAGVTVAALITGLSFSRANTVAVIVAIGLWLLLGPGITMTKRILIPLVGLIAAIPILDILILRNEYDPDGGSRPILLETGLRQIADTLWLGVGPNNYLNVVGKYDAYAAGGLPVHSAFLLALAELGLISMVLVMIPLALALVRSLRLLASRGASRAFAVALVAATPGILLIAATGWGLLREQYLILMFFAIGYLVGAQKHSEDADPLLHKQRVSTIAKPKVRSAHG